MEGFFAPIAEPKRKVGYLSLKGQYFKTWKVWWFVIDVEYASSLHYFIDDSERIKKGSIKVDANSTILSTVEQHNDQKHVTHVFQLVTQGTTFSFSVDDLDSFKSWIETIQRTIDFQKATNKLRIPTEFKRPILAHVANLLCLPPQMMQISHWSQPNDIFAAIDIAKKSTGLSDFGFSGDDFMIRGYNITRCLGIQRSGAEYTALGYFFSLENLSKRARDRLELVEYMRRHPQVAKMKLAAPVFVIGFPRTGTTFLHELLGLHPKVCMHYLWEQVKPVPDTHDESLVALISDRKKRHGDNKGRFDMFLALGGHKMQNIHRVGYDDPEECTTPLALELPWNIPEMPFTIFAAEEVIAMGAGDAFRLYRQYLQLLTWQSPDRRPHDLTWMLKCPFHLPYLTELTEAFPDATIVWTHRDPVECIASACSLYETGMHMLMDPASIDRVALGKAVLRYTRIALDKAFESLKTIESKMKVIHVRYADNVKSPKDICRQVVASAGLDFTPEYEARIDSYLEKNLAERALMKAASKSEQLHVYSLEEYGLTKELVRDMFADYTDKYQLVKEPGAGAGAGAWPTTPKREDGTGRGFDRSGNGKGGDGQGQGVSLSIFTLGEAVVAIAVAVAVWWFLR